METNSIGRQLLLTVYNLQYGIYFMSSAD